MEGHVDATDETRRYPCPEHTGPARQFSAGAAGNRPRSVVVDELDVPVRRVGEVQEREPLTVGDAPERAATERSPPRTHGLLQELHPGLIGGPSALAQVAGDARADHVLPGGLPSLCTRHHVVEVELVPGKVPAAVLAGVAIPRV